MQLPLSSYLRLLPRLLWAAVTACASMSALAAVAPGSERPRDDLKIGMQYVAAPYVAGAKFRTSEAIESVLAEDLARRLPARLASVRTEAGQLQQALKAGKADLLLAVLPEQDPQRQSLATVATGYVARPMAIMRTDTSIKSWEQLKGRTVCVAESGRYVGSLAAQYGALEKVFKAPADALLDLRIGGCDAAVHDSALLEELIKLPEWKKFSARLPAGPRLSLDFVMPAGDAKTRARLQQVARQWQADAYLQQQISLMVRNIAFEVYLDQNVPDCH